MYISHLIIKVLALCKLTQLIFSDERNVENNSVIPGSVTGLYALLTHCGPVTQICVLTLQLCRADDANLRFNTRLVSTLYRLNYAIHGAFLRMDLLTDVHRN